MRFRHRADTMFLLVMGGRVLTMQTGFAMLESAYGEKMNAANIMMKNTMDLLSGALAFFFFGYWLAYEESVHWDDENNFDYAMWFTQFSYATTAATIDSGALAGRVAFSSYIIFSICMTGVVYPLCVRMTWGGGWLHDLGFMDFAGSAIVHMVGSVSACTSATLIGPRIGRFPKFRVGGKLWRLLSLDRRSDDWYQGPLDEVERAIFVKPKNISNPVQALFGLFVLIIGFLGFNPGSTFATTGGTDLLGARATVTTLLAGSGGSFACIAWSLIKTKTPNITIPNFVTGVLAGLVSSCACCHAVTPLVSICIGFMAAFAAFLSDELITSLQIDDPVGAIAVHGPPGVVGALSLAIFAKPHCLSDLKGLVYGGGADAWEQLGIQIVGVLSLAGVAAGATYLLVTFINLIWGFRCDRSAELVGLDYTEHNYDDGSYTADINKVNFLEHSPLRKYSINTNAISRSFSLGGSKSLAQAEDGGIMSKSWSLGGRKRGGASPRTAVKSSAAGGAESDRETEDKPKTRVSDYESTALSFDGGSEREGEAPAVSAPEMQSLLEEMAVLKKLYKDMYNEMKAMKEHMGKSNARQAAVQQLKQREELQLESASTAYGAGLRTLHHLARDLAGAGHPGGGGGGGGGAAATSTTSPRTPASQHGHSHGVVPGGAAASNQWQNPESPVAAPESQKEAFTFTDL